MFVVLDGVDGCGKTTQAERLTAGLRARGREVVHVREPGTTAVGERLRALLLDPALELSASVETLLFAAARRQMLDEVVVPALAAGADVVCERFHASTFAYQGHAGALDSEAVLALLRGWSTEPAPDLELIFTLDVAESLRRRGPASDRIEAKGAAYLEAVADGYRAYAARPDVAAVAVDASADPDVVAERVWAAVAPLFDVDRSRSGA